ncbi:DUF3781 domain-containing protein [Lactococcus petauri]|uniref:DUF3781 domain-containing protein n=2 Tax=Lactococcus petauri TaxID=1940789 RepID=UPI0003105265|nr:DUF3781 domain-containing protein [Lactococcus petauri]MCV5952197.1 DUF3781 domain-containing protein [Lactococcus petauri]MCV5966738.1 DUF3781 domain-containing protein [Lactococcus petauri]MCV5969208.1 DUF3781 domain-containing protein [Lactococcus petauri]MCV5980052.1 DUF3781 domain-containing protein [Lactococcus petauri]
MKDKILENLCYTPLVYARINKKLKLNLSNIEIEHLIYETISDYHSEIEKVGKNFYIYNHSKKIRTTVNSYTYRVITADKI